MIQSSIDVLTQFPIRKSKAQKTAFRHSITEYLTELGYECREEKGSLGARNLVIGDADNAAYLITAHYDTPARMFLPNFITPCNLAVYLAYQFLIVGILVLFTFVCCFSVALLTDNYAATMLTGYVAYFGVLLLMMVGPANKNNANDNTSGVVSVLELAARLPVEKRNKVCFVLFDLEEAGLVGSASYQKTHKKVTSRQTVINLDCVGDGDELVIFPTKKLRKDASRMTLLQQLEGEWEDKKIVLHKKGFAFCPSDQANFPYGAGIMAFRRSKLLGLYCDKIHTNKDTVLEYKNITTLTEALLKLL